MNLQVVLHSAIFAVTRIELGLELQTVKLHFVNNGSVPLADIGERHFDSALNVECYRVRFARTLRRPDLTTRSSG